MNSLLYTSNRQRLMFCIININKKYSGPNANPCGTPDDICDWRSLTVQNHTVCCDQLVRQKMIHLRMYGLGQQLHVSFRKAFYEGLYQRPSSNQRRYTAQTSYVHFPYRSPLPRCYTHPEGQWLLIFCDEIPIDASYNWRYRNNEDSFVDNLMLGVQLADVSIRCSSHPQGKSEARCEIDGNLQAWLLSLRAHAVRCRGPSTNAVGASAA